MRRYHRRAAFCVLPRELQANAGIRACDEHGFGSALRYENRARGDKGRETNRTCSHHNDLESELVLMILTALIRRASTRFAAHRLAPAPPAAGHRWPNRGAPPYARRARRPPRRAA